MANPWADYRFLFWFSGDGLAIEYKKSHEFSGHLILKLTHYGVYRYDYSNHLSEVDSDHRIRVMRPDFNPALLKSDKKPSFVKDHEVVYNDVKIILWRDAINPLVVVTMPGVVSPVEAFCLLAITPEGLWRCSGNPGKIFPVDSSGRILILRGAVQGITT